MMGNPKPAKETTQHLRRVEVDSSVTDQKQLEDGDCFYREVPTAIFLHIMPGG